MNMKPLSSVTTTAAKGNKFADIDAAYRNWITRSINGEQTKAVAHLLSADDPQAVTRKVTDLVHTLIPSLTPKYSSNFDLLGYTIKGKHEAASMSKAVRHVRQSLQVCRSMTSKNKLQ